MVYVALATYNAWPNIDAAMHGGDGALKAAATAFLQYIFACGVAISSVASAREKGGQVAVLVFMLVNGYFAYDAASHRHDEAHTTISRKDTINEELGQKKERRKAIGDNFERVSEKQLEEAEHKRDVAEKRCLTCANTRAAQKEVDRLGGLRTKTKDADDLDKAITKLNTELKALKDTGDSDGNLAKITGGNATTLSTAITLLIALAVELANKYLPYWMFRFIAGGLGYPQSSPYEQRKAEKAADKARKVREAEEAEARRREAEARASAEAEEMARAEAEARAAAAAEEKAKAERAAKREAYKTREKGDPETIGRWLNSKRVVQSPDRVSPTTLAYDDYAADCRARGETPVSKRGPAFVTELRKRGFEVREVGNGRRFEIHGLALASHAERPGLRIVSSR